MASDGGADGGVDVTSGACAPAKGGGEPKPKPKPKPKAKELPEAVHKDLSQQHAGAVEDRPEDCTSERVLTIRPGTCTWFLVQVRAKRFTPEDRTTVENQLKRIVEDYCQSVPTHTEEE